MFIMAWHTTLSFVAIYATSLGASPPLVGLVISATVVLPVLFGVHVGAAVDTLGTSRVARWSSVLFAASYLAMAFGTGLGQLAVTVSAAGLADIGLVVATQAYVASASTPATRDHNFGYYGLWVSSGALVGPVLGGYLVDRWGHHAAFGGSAVLALLTAAVCWTLPAQAARPRDDSGGATQALQSARLLLRDRGISLVMLVSAFLMVAYSLRQSFYPLYLQSVGFSTTLIGAIMSFNSLCQIATRPTLAITAARIGHVGILRLGIVLTAVGTLMTPFLTSLWALALAYGLVGVAQGYMQPLSMSLVSGQAGAGQRGVALGLRFTVNQVAQAIGPPLFGFAVAGFGLGAAFYAAAGVAWSAFIWVGRLARETGQAGGRERKVVELPRQRPFREDDGGSAATKQTGASDGKIAER